MKSFEYHGVKECIIRWVGLVRCKNSLQHSLGWKELVPTNPDDTSYLRDIKTIGTGIRGHTWDFLSQGNHKIKAMPRGVQSEGRAVGICGAIVSYILTWCRRRRSWLSHDIVSDMRWWYIEICSVLYISISIHPSIHTSFPSIRLFSVPSLTTRGTPQPSLRMNEVKVLLTGQTSTSNTAKELWCLKKKAVNEH